MNTKSNVFKSSIIIVLLAIGSMFKVHAQIDIKGKIQEKVNQRANEKVDQAIDKGLDKTEEGIKKGTQKKEKETKDETVQPSTNTEESDNNTTPEVAPTKPAAKEEPLKLYSKFDFIPGDQVLFFDDFSQDALNEYPLYWLTNGSSEVLKYEKYPESNWFRMNCDVTNETENKLSFAENTTIEFDLIPHNTSSDMTYSDFTIRFWQAGEEQQAVGSYVPGIGGFWFKFSETTVDGSSWADGIYNPTLFSATTNEVRDNENKKIHFSIWIQKRRVRLYVNQFKVIDAPQMVPQNLVINKMDFYSSCYNDKFSLLVSNIKIAVGSPDTRNKLITEGKFVTNGIKFDSGSDKIKPESYSVIKEIATVLTENPAINVKIIGHTDSDGEDATNLDLSKKRAIAVKNMLNKDFSIDLNRIQTDGKGETMPIAPNTTPEGKASNRRVEFIKL